MEADQASRTYRLEALDSSGVFLGLGVVQSGLLGAGITLGVLGITAGLQAPVAAIPMVAAVVASFARLGGRPAWEWLPLGLGWVWSSLRRGRDWTAPLALWPTESVAPLPPCLSGLELVEVEWRPSGPLGAIKDDERKTLTSVVPVTGAQFLVEPRAEQERLLAGWGDVVGQFAQERGAVTHITWSDLSRPSGMHHHVAWVADRDRGDVTPDARTSYSELVDLGNDTAITHDVVVTLTVARDRLGRNRERDADLLGRALVAATEALLRGLRSAGLTAADPLDSQGIQRLMRTRIDPVSAAPRVTTGRLIDRLAHVQRNTAGPLAVHTEWSYTRVDGALHRTWWIGTWPRLAVPPSWLEPFLSSGGMTRTMTVILVPVSTHQSRRRIERDLVKLDSDAVTKEKQGRRVDARHHRAAQALLTREEELVAGYPEVAYAGLVTVSAGTQSELEEQSEIIEQMARENGMDLRSLDARQDLAWAAALPLGLAPATLLAS